MSATVPDVVSNTVPRSSASASARPKGWKRRVAKACTPCREKKRKCDGARPICTKCNASATACAYADHERPSLRAGKEKVDYIKQLEARLRHVEGVLRQTRECLQRADDDNFGQLERNSHSTHLLAGSREASDTASDIEQNVEEYRRPPVIPESRHPPSKDFQNALLVEGCTGELRFFGPSSSVSFMSPNGLDWIESHTSDSSLRDSIQTPLQTRGQWTGWTHPLIEASFAERHRGRLPPLSDAVALVNDYMATFNRILPIFHPATFMALLKQQYAQKQIRNPAYWASLNAVLAMTQRRLSENTNYSLPQNDTPWISIRNALDVLLDVLMRNTSLLSVQALVALAWFFEGTPNPQPSFFLASAAVKMCHAIGLHQPHAGSVYGGAETRQRECIFWAATILDQSASFRTGRPASQALQDIRIPLPAELLNDPTSTIESKSVPKLMPVFRHMAHIAKTQARIHQELYSIPPSSRPKDAVLETVQLLDNIMTDLKQSISIEYRPDLPTSAWENPIDLNVMRLHLEYHHCMITIHRIDGHSGFQSLNAKAQRDQPVLALSSMEKCLAAARSTLRLIENTPRLVSGSFQWSIAHFPISAIIVLFIDILQRPRSENASRDLDAMSNNITIFSSLSSHEDNNYARSTTKIMSELHRIASAAVSKATHDLIGDGVRTSSEKTGPASTIFVGGTIPAETMDNGGSAYDRAADDHTPRNQTTTSATIPDQAFEQWLDEASRIPLPFPWGWHDIPTDWDQWLQQLNTSWPT